MSSNDASEAKQAAVAAEGASPKQEDAAAQPAAENAAAGAAPAAKSATGEAAKKEASAAKPAAKEEKKPPTLADTKHLHKTSSTDEVVIRFDRVTKTYHLYKSDRGRFLGVFNIHRKGDFLGSVNANDELSFEIKRGEAVAFLGRNGAGKSTALKIITGVVHPTSGTAEVNGRVSALLELQAGFDPQLSGRENINLRGQILGISAEELAEIEPKVIDFAELGLYIDQPLKSYSSGMKARLGFALAVSIDPEILVVDEALSVGDKAFREKCIARIRDIMMNERVTVLFVTHASNTAQRFCSRGIVLDSGRKVFDGSIEDATVYYEKHY